MQENFTKGSPECIHHALQATQERIQREHGQDMMTDRDVYNQGVQILRAGEWFCTNLNTHTIYTHTLQTTGAPRCATQARTHTNEHTRAHTHTHTSNN